MEEKKLCSLVDELHKKRLDYYTALEKGFKEMVGMPISLKIESNCTWTLGTLGTKHNGRFNVGNIDFFVTHIKRYSADEGDRLFVVI